MKLIVGLGNPGKEYAETRHNMGYLAIDAFAEMAGVDFDRSGFKGVYAICKDPRFNDSFILAKPETFMNLSGECVRPLMDYFKIDLDDVVILYDDMALAPGTIRLRPSGSSGSHNGMKSIIQHVGSENFKRIRIGIGEPPHTGVDWVLSKPKGEDKDLLDQGIEKAAKAVRDYLMHDWNYAMNHGNAK